MATAERRAEVVWEGDLPRGNGKFTVGSGAMGEQAVTWASRTERSDGKTSPEELIAAAHASCFSMALSHELAQAGNAPERLHVTSTVSLDPKEGGGVVVTRSALEVNGTVAGLDQDGFQRAAEEAEKGCPISNAIRGNLEITVKATLES